MKSYTSTRLGTRARGSELVLLLRRELQDVARSVATDIAEMREVERVTRERLGQSLSNQRILEIGSGPNSGQLAYLAVSNDAVGIDANIVPRGLDPGAWLTMVRHNGWLRSAKTLARRSLLLDERYRREMARRLGCERWPSFDVLEMNATRLGFPDASFDFVFSRAVFEHIADPGAAMDEIRRVLKPGGAMFVIFHLYTSDSGCHDPRVLAGSRGGLPHWSHLQPEHSHLVRPNAYLNELRLDEWTELFATRLPDSEVEARVDAAPDHVEALQALRAQDKLASYSDTELLSPTVWALWKKPRVTACG